MRLFFATVDAALELLPRLEVEEDRVWLHGQLQTLDMTVGPCVIEILVQAQNNKGMHRKDTFFLVRSPASVMLHPVLLSRSDLVDRSAAADVEAELTELREFKAKVEAAGGHAGSQDPV